MRKELDKMISKVQDPEKRAAVAKEMDNFFHLFTRYLNEKAKGKRLYVLLVCFLMYS
jgi:UTP--glucose-1-phosphate uridylyltransferase